MGYENLCGLRIEKHRVLNKIIEAKIIILDIDSRGDIYKKNLIPFLSSLK